MGSTGKLSELPGSFKVGGTEAIEAGYLACDGSGVSRAVYAALFARIGTKYGIGDGLTSFNLPYAYGQGFRFIDPTATVDLDQAARAPFSASTFTFTGDTQSGLQLIINISPTDMANLAVGMALTFGDIPSPAYIDEIILPSTVHITAIMTGSTPGATITASNGASGPYVGSYQGDEFASHHHAPPDGSNFPTTHAGGATFAGGGGVNTFPTTANTGGNETRGKNFYVQLMIKY